MSEKSRKFLIRHNCGSLFVIDAKKFPSSFELQEGKPQRKKLICPNCDQPLGPDGLLSDLKMHLKGYQKLVGSLKDTGCFLTEIPEEDFDYRILSRLLAS